MRGGDERGAVAVEAALVTPLILLLIFGMIEFTMVLRDQVAVSSSVRAGARTASAEPRILTMGDDAAAAVTRAVSSLSDEGLTEGELWIYKAGAGPEAPEDCSTELPALHLGRLAVRLRVTASGTCPRSTPAPSRRATPRVLDAVGVYLRYRHDFLTGLFGAGLTLGEAAVLNFEPAPPAEGCL